MTLKLMVSASAFVVAAVLASGAAAGPRLIDSAGANVGNDGAATSTNTADSNNTSTKTWTDSSTTTNTDSSTKNDSSFNTLTKTYTDSSTTTKNEDSFNTDNSVYNKESGNTIASNNTKTIDSNNTDSSTHTNTTNNTENKTWNDNSVHTATMSKQDLGATVTGTAVTFDGPLEGTFTTGDIGNSGGAFASYAGIQTSSANTGVGSLNQAATSLAANASISFGAAP